MVVNKEQGQTVGFVKLQLGLAKIKNKESQTYSQPCETVNMKNQMWNVFLDKSK